MPKGGLSTPARQVIKDRLVQEKKLEEETALLLATLSTGSLGLALRMCEGGFLEKRQAWLLKLVKLPGLSKEDAFEMAVECADEAHRAGFHMSDAGEPGILNLLDMWETWYRDMLVLRVGGSEEFLMNRDFSRKLKIYSEKFSIQPLIHSIFAINQTKRDLARMGNIKLVMQSSVLSLKGLLGG